MMFPHLFKASLLSSILSGILTEPDAEVTQWLNRAGIQMEFAREFAALFPDKADLWKEKIDRAEELFRSVEPHSGFNRLKSAVIEAESSLAEIGEAAKAYTMHCVGHGHIDMNWQWGWHETVDATYKTFASVLTLMNEYPDLTYSQSQASVYALVEEHFPEMFDAIKERVREGRWEIAASQWVEGDKNLSSGESLCRHLLYTREYFQSKFGLSPEDLPIDWEPDTFGHAATIPSIVSQGAVRYYYSCRQGGQGEFNHPRVGDARPALFYWAGPDGSRVLVNREITWYNSYENIGDNIALPLVRFAQETGLNHWLNVFGIGNHGGGPTRTEINSLREMQLWPLYPRIEFSTAKRYFECAERQVQEEGLELPTLAHELNFEFTGCYTSQSLIKMANRFGENALVEAETLAALAHRLTGMNPPAKILRESWLKVLFNQFHDILPGSGVRETREHALGTFQEAFGGANSIKTRAFSRLFGTINTKAMLAEQQCSPNNRVFAVYNPLTWARSERVSVDVYDAGFNNKQVVAVHDSGRRVQTLCTEDKEDFGHRKQTYEFELDAIPALGYRTVALEEGVADPGFENIKDLGRDWFETPFLKFRLDRCRTGLLDLIDKRTGAVLIASKGPDHTFTPLGGLIKIMEQPRSMSSWCLGAEATPASYLLADRFHISGFAGDVGKNTHKPLGSSAMRVTAMLRVPGTKSTARLTTSISTLKPRIDFEAEINWCELGSKDTGTPGLSVSFPLALRDIVSSYETPFGSVQRSFFDGEEVPALRYAHLRGLAATEAGKDVRAGFTLVQDSKYGHSIQGSELRMRVLRSSYDPDPAPEISTTTVKYSLYLHDDWPAAGDAARLGAEWNHAVIPYSLPEQDGLSGLSRSFAEVQPTGVQLTALKTLESGDGLMFRVVECNGVDTEVRIRVDDEAARGLRQAWKLDLLERRTGERVEWADGTLRFEIGAHGIVSIGLVEK